jgi:endonuclease YncB( thermonuclease family)
MRTAFCSLFLLLLLYGIGAGDAAERGRATLTVLPGKVTRVVDGDTIVVLLTSGTIRVRLHGIDAPERNQPGGPAATTWLAEELQNQQVQLEPVSQDRYDRMVAVVHREERNINRELIQAGHAWAYRQYMRRSDEQLCALEARARLKGAGLWATTAHAPWEHRATNGKGPFTSFTGTTALDCGNAIGRKAP